MPRVYQSDTSFRPTRRILRLDRRYKLEDLLRKRRVKWVRALWRAVRKIELSVLLNQETGSQVARRAIKNRICYNRKYSLRKKYDNNYGCQCLNKGDEYRRKGGKKR